jgi:hypothetical protein
MGNILPLPWRSIGWLFDILAAQGVVLPSAGQWILARASMDRRACERAVAALTTSRSASGSLSTQPASRAASSVLPWLRGTENDTTLQRSRLAMVSASTGTQYGYSTTSAGNVAANASTTAPS